MTELRKNWKSHFFTIWIGQQASLIGSTLAQFALVWWLTDTTGSATVLATATMVAMLPQILIGPFSGALIDRFSRRSIMILSDGTVAVSSMLLVYLFHTGDIAVWHIYLIMAIRALGSGFQWPAMTATTSLMVPEKQLTRIAGLTYTMQGATNIISPPLGAILLALLPMYGIMAIDVFTAAVAIGSLVVIPVPRPERLETQKVASYFADVKAGFEYVWRWRGLLFVIGIATFINFAVQPAFSLLPLLVRNHFLGEAMQLGWLESGFGVGILVGGVVLSTWGGFHKRIYTSLMGMIGMGLGLAIMGLLPQNGILAGIGISFLVGANYPVVNGPLEALLQARIEHAMQGRVLALLGSLVTAMSPISMAIAGPVADLLGIRFWYIFGGMIMILVASLAFFVPEIRNIETHQAESEVTSRQN
jgi:DHA3 family macrolide efflux protein-like MFS transporter